MKTILFAILILLPSLLISQSIEVDSFNENPLEVSPLLGGDLQVNIKYTSQAGSQGNNLYIGLEELDENNQFVRTIDGKSYQNQPAGTDVQLSVHLFVGSIQPLSADLPDGHTYQVIARLYTNTWTELASAGYWNTPTLITQDTFGYDFSDNPLHKGADVSWMTEMEAEGYTWQDNEGNATELMPLLADYDLDAIRLRVWVDPENSPANGWCDIDDMVTKAILADNQGMDVMVCIHYSDHWADPGQQTKPAAWSSFTTTQLANAVANHTTDILTALAAEGITPKWVQIGNETNDGMLWNTGRASTGGFANYASFLNAGSLAVKNFDNTIKTILHLASGNDANLYQWNIGGLLNNGLVFSRFDIIGMSLYPDEDNWKELVDDTYSNMNSLQSQYNKEVMMVEVGFSNNRPDISYQFLVYMMEKTRQANGLGVFYWEPIARSPFTSYGKGAWDDDGSPSVAMDAFLDSTTFSNELFEEPLKFKVYPNPSSSILKVETSLTPLNKLVLYDLNGRVLQQHNPQGNQYSLDVSMLSKGIYLLQINRDKTLKIVKN